MIIFFAMKSNILVIFQSLASFLGSPWSGEPGNEAIVPIRLDKWLPILNGLYLEWWYDFISDWVYGWRDHQWDWSDSVRWFWLVPQWRFLHLSCEPCWQWWDSQTDCLLNLCEVAWSLLQTIMHHVQCMKSCIGYRSAFCREMLFIGFSLMPMLAKSLGMRLLCIVTWWIVFISTYNHESMIKVQGRSHLFCTFISCSIPCTKLVDNSEVLQDKHC